MIHDVPSPIDFRLMSDALEWESTAMSKRPSRIEFFSEFAAAIKAMPIPVTRVLELGSGPGFLAESLLNALPAISYVALDFSAAMHQLARNRLGSLASRVDFFERNFKEPGWSHNLGLYEAIVTHQVVHELRHKHYACSLHAQARELLVSTGSYLVCDHFLGEGGMKNGQLYMTVTEQCDALLNAGFSNVQQLMLKDGLVLHCAT